METDTQQDVKSISTVKTTIIKVDQSSVISINKISKEKKENKKRVEILINRLNYLKKMEEEAKHRIENIKQKLIKDESNKVFKEEVKDIKGKAKSSSMEVLNRKKDEVKIKKDEEKKLREKKFQEMIIKNKEKYSESYENRRLITNLIDKIENHEKMIKSHNYSKQKSDQSQLRMNRRMKELEEEQERKERINEKIKTVITEAEEVKGLCEKLSEEEVGLIEKINQTIQVQNKEIEKIKTEVSKALRSNKNEYDKYVKLNNALSGKKIDYGMNLKGRVKEDKEKEKKGRVYSSYQSQNRSLIQNEINRSIVERIIKEKENEKMNNSSIVNKNKK